MDYDYGLKGDTAVQLDSASALASSDEELYEKRGCWAAVVGCLSMCVKPFADRVYKEDDDEETRVRKWLGMSVLCFLCVVQPIFILFSYRAGDYMVATCTSMRTFSCFATLAYCMVTRNLTRLTVEVCCISFGIIFSFATDLADFGQKDQWVSIMVISDGMLLMGARQSATIALTIITCLFLTFKSIEEGVGLGVYDNIPSSWSSTTPRDTEGAGWMVIVALVRVLVFLIDSYMTYKFATGMRAAEAKSANAVKLAKKIAQSLVRFDLDEAEYALSKVGGADELQDVFVELLANLRMYKPYLPDALFARSHSAEDGFDRSTFDHQTRSFVVRNIAPGGNSGDVSIAFTDIQSSTDIWEKHTAGMRAAMEHHNDIMREAITEANGYEVKTIGDAFMVAFDSALEAFQYGLRSQEMLYTTEWPRQILDHPLCKKTEGLWNGLRVRIGIHTGSVKLELNPTTGRTDYMGPTVNKAARIESASAGGAVAYTDEVWNAISEPDRAKLESPVIKNIGMQDLKGVGMVPVYVAIPKMLAGRVAEVERTIRKRAYQKKHPPSLTGSIKSTAVPMSEAGGRMHTIQRNKLVLSSGSVVCVRVNYDGYTKSLSTPVDAINDLVTGVLDAVERTEGLTCSVCSSYIVLSFNCGRSCPMHASQSCKFVSHLFGTLRGSQWERLVTVGVAGGDLLHGMLGSTKQRFATIFGDAVEMSKALSDSAAQLGTFCLMMGATDRSIDLHTRQIDRWNMGTGPAKAVCELNLETFSEVQGAWNIYDGVIPPEWGPRYEDAFNAEDVEALADLSPPSDKVMLNIIRVLRRQLVLTQPLVVDTPSVFALSDGLLAV